MFFALPTTCPQKGGHPREEKRVKVGMELVMEKKGKMLKKKKHQLKPVELDVVLETKKIKKNRKKVESSDNDRKTTNRKTAKVTENDGEKKQSKAANKKKDTGAGKKSNNGNQKKGSLASTSGKKVKKSVHKYVQSRQILCC